MGDTAAIVVSLVWIAASLILTMYLLGSLTGALACVSTGPFGRIGLGALGLLLASPLLALSAHEAPAWVTWIVSPIAAASLVCAIRRMRRRRAEHRGSNMARSEHAQTAIRDLL